MSTPLMQAKWKVFIEKKQKQSKGIIWWKWKKLKLLESESEWLLRESCSLRPHGLYSPWNSPGQNTGVGSLCLLQWVFPTQGSNPGLPHCRQVLYQLSYQGSPGCCLSSYIIWEGCVYWLFLGFGFLTLRHFRLRFHFAHADC